LDTEKKTINRFWRFAPRQFITIKTITIFFVVTMLLLIPALIFYAKEYPTIEAADKADFKQKVEPYYHSLITQLTEDRKSVV
jgi:hypothetical protein